MTLHVARWDDFGYAGKTIDRGQVVEMVGAINDEKLIRLGFITEMKERNPRILECGECGAKFLDDTARVAHGRKRHPRRERIPAMVPAAISPLGEPSEMAVDIEGDREERQRMDETPLFLDKTQASMKG